MNQHFPVSFVHPNQEQGWPQKAQRAGLLAEKLAALRLGDPEPRECTFIRMATKEHKVHKTGTVGHNHESHKTQATTDDSNTGTPHFSLFTLHFALPIIPA